MVTSSTHARTYVLEQRPNQCVRSVVVDDVQPYVALAIHPCLPISCPPRIEQPIGMHKAHLDQSWLVVRSGRLALHLRPKKKKNSRGRLLLAAGEEYS